MARASHSLYFTASRPSIDARLKACFFSFVGLVGFRLLEAMEVLGQQQVGEKARQYYGHVLI